MNILNAKNGCYILQLIIWLSDQILIFVRFLLISLQYTSLSIKRVRRFENSTSDLEDIS